MSDAARRSGFGGVSLVLGSTVISAATSFLILLLVAPAIGPERYASFSVYWSALYMVVGVLFGIQQETTRTVAARALDKFAEKNTRLFRFAWSVAAVTLAGVLLSAIVWAVPLFGAEGGSWAIPLAIGVSSYVLVATLNGITAGSNSWRLFALLPVIDGVLRIVLVIIALIFNLGGAALAWAVAIPFPVSFLIVRILSRHQITQFGVVAERYGTLLLNSGRTMLASFSTAVLVNGFPVILALAAHPDKAELGAVVLALTLTRAPILVPLTALQSMLISKFSGTSHAARQLLLKVLFAIVIGTALVAGATFIWGEELLRIFFGSGFALSGTLLAGLVASSGALGVLTATGASVLATNRHNAFAAGWLLASVVSVLIIVFVPGDLGAKTATALLLGPLLGAVVHLVAWKRSLQASLRD